LQTYRTVGVGDQRPYVKFPYKGFVGKNACGNITDRNVKLAVSDKEKALRKQLYSDREILFKEDNFSKARFRLFPTVR
jgi:hypothetical protein